MLNKKQKLLLSCISLLSQPLSIYAKGGGAGTGSSGSGSSTSSGSSSSSSSNRSYGSGWVFWYYGTDGGRQCGNYCIITFSISGFLILLVILCGIWRCYEIHKSSKHESIGIYDNEIGISDDEDEYNNNNNTNHHYHNYLSTTTRPSIYSPLSITNNNSSTTTSPLYAPLSKTHDTPPPTYNNISAAPEPSHLFGLKHESTWEAYKAGQKFCRENPPIEEKPPSEHINYINTNNGPECWKIVLEESVSSSRHATVSNNGLTIEFHKRADVMVQANYPIFNPFEGSDSESDESAEDIITPTSIMPLNLEKNQLPLYSYNYNLQAPSPLHIEEDTHLSSSRNRIVPGDIISSRSTPKGSTPGATPRDGTSRAVTPTKEITMSIPIFLYFEITVLSKPGKETTIAMGLATKPYPNFRLPGWHKNSVGYHSDDGRKFYNESYGGKNYSETWGAVGDVIGCGYWPKTGIVFFTKNGKNLGNAFSGVRHVWFPTVGADNKCKIEFNFGGGKKPFRYKEARGTSVMGLFKPVHISDGVEFSNEKI